MKKKVVIGLSGGVDSSVAAYLLKEQGYDVIGVTMQIWQDNDSVQQDEDSCSGIVAVEDAKRVANLLDIPFYVVNFRDEFRQAVINYFISEYQRGYTPNPCNVCNRRIKWEALLGKAKEMGAEYIATGHYARIKQLENGRYTIQNSITAQKDQTYALYNLTQEQLSRTLMPVGAYSKDEIRQIAERIHLPVAHKQDSQDICFIPDKDYAAFIEQETGKKSIPGNFVDENGVILGKHKGIEHYTVGQRKGLGLTAPTPLFVKSLNPEKNEVVICQSEGLFADTCLVTDMNYMAIDRLAPGESIEAIGKVRYSHQGAPCVITAQENGEIKCRFKEAQRAMTPGQAAVFYRDDYVLCGGTIARE